MVPSPVGTGRGVSRTTGTLNVCEVRIGSSAALRRQPEAAALLVDGVRVGDVEEGVHVIAWPFDVVAAAMGVLSHRARARAGGAAWRVAVAASPPLGYGLPHPGGMTGGMTYTSPLAEELADDVLDRFLRYVRVDTQSAREPRRDAQHAGAARALADARRRAARDGDRGRRARRARLRVRDAAGRARRAGRRAARPRRHEPGRARLRRRADRAPRLRRRRGSSCPRNGTVLDPAKLPVLAGKAGHDVVTSSGDTLLGADDKAGVAEIMAAVAYLAAHPELPRPTLKLGFTPDEEIGRGAAAVRLRALRRRVRLHARRLAARRAAGRDVLRRRGRRSRSTASTPTRAGRPASSSTPPGSPRACSRALPSDTLTPETTADREGFVHPYEVDGDAGRADGGMIVRDFDDELLEQHVAARPAHRRGGRRAEPTATLGFDVRTQYPNMRALRGGLPAGRVQVAERAIRAEGIEPVRIPIRGGTDGAILSQHGPADAEPVHRRARVPLGARVGLAAGHGLGRRGGRAARREWAGEKR